MLDIWDEQELLEMFELYNINEKDIETIVLDLYLPYDSKVINPNEDILNRKKYLNKIVKETLDKTDISILMHLETLNLNDIEKEYIITKRNKLKTLKQHFITKNTGLGTV